MLQSNAIQALPFWEFSKGLFCGLPKSGVTQRTMRDLPAVRLNRQKWRIHHALCRARPADDAIDIPVLFFKGSPCNFWGNGKWFQKNCHMMLGEIKDYKSTVQCHKNNSGMWPRDGIVWFAICILLSCPFTAATGVANITIQVSCTCCLVVRLFPVWLSFCSCVVQKRVRVQGECPGSSNIKDIDILFIIYSPAVCAKHWPWKIAVLALWP